MSTHTIISQFVFNSFVQANNQEVRTVINTALDIDGETKPLASKYVVLVNKQTPVVLYPIQYIKVCWLCGDKSWYVREFIFCDCECAVGQQPAL